jgi:hypothetical protein
MPWYMNPVRTSKVLNRIANRHARASLRELTAVLDQVTEKLWSKQEYYYEETTSPRLTC